MENGFSRRGLVFAIFILTLVFSLGAQAGSKKIAITPAHVPGELLVRIKQPQIGTLQTATISAVQTLKSVLGANAVQEVKPLRTDAELIRIRLTKDSNMTAALDVLKNDPRIVRAEPNFIVRAIDNVPVTPPASPFDVVNDADFGKLWGMSNTGQTDSGGQVGTPGADIHVMDLWKEGITGSKKVLVAIIDTGVNWNHPDLKDNIYTNPGETDPSKGDHDGNGFDNDIHGWNFVDNTPNSNDDHGHGSHVAGTIGGIGNNGIGVAGVNWNVSILPVKFLSKDGSGSLEGAIESINYARIMKANIMSNSWGGGGYSDELKDAIVKARDAGILFVAAAGNDSSNNESSPHFPSSYEVDNVLSVAATDNKDTLAYFSNYGRNHVHVSAPGHFIYSTVLKDGYDTYSGTSMATPHVSGVAALVLSQFPDMTYSDLKARIIKTSDPIGVLRRKSVSRGRVNAYNAVKNIIPPSTEPDETAWIDVAQAVESEHPYKEKTNKTFAINVPGAKYIRIHFEKVEVESFYDFVKVENSKGQVVEDLTGQMDDYTSDYVEGDSAVIRITSDDSMNGYGFKVDKIQVIK